MVKTCSNGNGGELFEIEKATTKIQIAGNRFSYHTIKVRTDTIDMYERFKAACKNPTCALDDESFLGGGESDNDIDGDVGEVEDGVDRAVHKTFEDGE